MFSRQSDGSDLSADFLAFPIVVGSIQIWVLIWVVPALVDFDVVRNRLPPSCFASRPLRGAGLAVFAHNSPCLRMSELHPKTAKPPLLRHQFRRRVRHRFRLERNRPWPKANLKLVAALSWFRRGKVVPTNRCCASVVVAPAPARGQRQLVFQARVPQPPTSSTRWSPSAWRAARGLPK
jgi:hypothetical protein